MDSCEGTLQTALIPLVTWTILLMLCLQECKALSRRTQARYPLLRVTRRKQEETKKNPTKIPHSKGWENQELTLHQVIRSVYSIGEWDWGNLKVESLMNWKIRPLV